MHDFSVLKKGTCGTTQVTASNVETAERTSRLTQAVYKHHPGRNLWSLGGISTVLEKLIHRKLYFGEEKDNCNYPGKYSLRILGEPYDVEYNGSPEQCDKLNPNSTSCDPRCRCPHSPIATIEERQESPAPMFQI